MPHASELKKTEIARWWADRETLGTSLLALVIDEYGTDSLGWDPETFRLQIQSDFGVELSRINMDKLMGMITAMTTNMFYQSVPAFTQIANALNNSGADFDHLEPPTAAESAWAITEITLSDPPKQRDQYSEQFSTDVRRYLGVILTTEGILHPPDVLQIAELDEQTQKNADVTFADDPSLYSGFYQLSQSKATDITQYVRSRINLLLTQLHALPLQNRDTHRWQKFMSQHTKP